MTVFSVKYYTDLFPQADVEDYASTSLRYASLILGIDDETTQIDI